MTTVSTTPRCSTPLALQPSRSKTSRGWSFGLLMEQSRRGSVWARSAVVLACAVMLSGVSGVEAQTLVPSWYQQSPANSPSARGNQVMAYDSAHQQTVLFGGGTVSDTWLWNGGTWTQANPVNSPPPRGASVMAYDSTHGQVVMFGGITPGSATARLGDTWLWNGTNWTQANVTGGPSARDGASMVYDPVHGEVVLFGGIDLSGSPLNDTWLWNGTTWTQAATTPATSPTARFSAGMAYDAATSSVVLFGGSYSGDMADTWIWNGTTWTQQQPQNSPSARDTMGMAYDASLGQVVLFGGVDNGLYLNDTWLWSGTTWTQYTTASSPSQRELNEDMVYDAGHSQVLLFGGLNFNQTATAFGDTWQFGLPGNFGNVNVCPASATTPAPCSKTVSFTYNVTAPVTFSAPQVLTQGTSGLDFQLNGTTCTGFLTGGTCTINVTFAPLAPGSRSGSIQLTGLLDNNSTVVTNTPIYGIGNGPAATIIGSLQTTLNTGSYTFTTPNGTLADAAGNLFISDATLGRVVKIAPGGTTSTVGVGLKAPQQMAEDGAGDLFIADSGLNEIVEVPLGCTTSSCQVAIATNLTSQMGVAVDGAGDLFIGDYNAGEVVESPAGCTTAACQVVVYSRGTSSHPVGIALDSAGDLFVADSGLAQVMEAPAGCLVKGCQVKIGLEWSNPVGVAVDAAGNVYASDLGLEQIDEVPVGCLTVSCEISIVDPLQSQALAIDSAGDLFGADLSDDSVFEFNMSQPQPLDFGTVYLGQTGTEAITLQNIGNQTLQAESPGLLTVSGASYSNTPGPGTPADCSATASLAPGATCNVSILFSPQSYTQPNTGTAVFADNALNNLSASQTQPFTGMGAKPVQNFYRVTALVPGTGSGTVTDVSGVLNCTETNGTSTGTCSASLPGSGTVTFTATATAGSTFQGWGGACANFATNANCSLVLTQPTTITATFVNAVTFPLTVTTSGNGQGTVTDNLGEIACSAANGLTLGLCSGPYPSGTLVSLTAAATGSSVFVGWGGACANTATIPTCVVTMSSALNVSASFVAPGASPSGTLSPITAGVVYGQGGSLTSNLSSNGGVSANSLGNAQGMFVDGGGNLYVADGINSRVLFYPAGSTTPTRVYGQGGSFTSNNSGTSANGLNDPQAIAVDGNGNVYISDEANSRVLFYPAGSTTATRVYGQGGSFTSGVGNNGGVSANSLQYPIGIALDISGNLYVADYGNSRILFYPSGSTTATRVYGQGGSFTSAQTNLGGISANSLNQAQSIALDSSGDLYAADTYNNRVLFYPANSTTATQVYGQSGSFTSGTANNGGVNSGTLDNPFSVAVDSNNNFYVVDRSNNRVLFYPFGSGSASRVYGQGGSFNTAALNNGGVSANSLNRPWSVAVGSNGNVYIADYGNNRVLGYGSFGDVNACAASQTSPAPCNNTITYSYAPAASTTFGATQVVTQGTTGLDFSLAGGNTCTGTISEGSTCNLNVNFAPLAPGLRMGSVQLFDITGNPLASALISGVGQEPVVVFGPGAQTALPLTGLQYPDGVAIDAAGDTFVADYVAGAVFKYSPAGVQTTVPATGLFAPIGVAVDGAGNVYIADLTLQYVVKITPSGVQSTLGTGLGSPLGITLDAVGDVFVGDQDNNRVVEITPGGVETTVPTTGLNEPWGVAVDAQGDIFIADGGNSRVIEVTAGGVQTTVPILGLSQPYGVAVDAAGDVYVADPLNTRVVEVPANGGPQFTVGSGLNYPSGVAVDGAGNILIGDQGAGQVFRLNRAPTPSISFATTNVGSTSTDSPVSFTAQNIGNLPLTGSVALNLGTSFTQSTAGSCSVAFPLAPGAVCGENFSFTPQGATFYSGTAIFTDNTGNNSPSATQTVVLVGTGATSGVAGTVAVPNVVGLAQASATSPINAVGLGMGTVSTASSLAVPSGSIISENPVAGTQVAVGSAVNLLVSSGLPQPPPPNPLSLENNYFLTGDYVSAGVTLRGTGNLTSKIATGTITIPNYTQSTTLGVPDGADIVDAFLYWETVENTATPSSTNGTFNGYSISGQQIGADIPNYTDGAVTGTLRAYRASVNIYLPVGANGVRIVSGAYTVSLPDSGGSTYPLTEGASLVLVYRVLSPNFPLKSVVIYDGAGLPTGGAVQVVQGFYDAVGGASGTGKSTTIFANPGNWNNSVNSVTLGQSNQYTTPLNTGAAYAAVMLSTPVNNSDNDGILDAWKTGPTGSDFHAGQPGYYDVKTSTWVGLPGATHGKKDLFVQLDYMCGALLSTGACDPTQENLFPSPDANGNDPLAMVQQAFAASGVQLHLTVGNAVPEDTCVDAPGQLCQFPGEPGVIGWKNSLEFSKLYPRNLASCLTGGDCTTRFPYGQKDSYHYVLFGHALAIPAWNSRFGSLTSINVNNGVTTIVTADRGTGINLCTSRITIAGVLGDPLLNGVYDKPTCADSKTITVATPGVPNYTYPNATLPEPVIGITFGQVTSISGYSDLGGADSAVTLGLWLTAPNQDMSKKANVIAGTLFHEIGHTLGLSHGGLYYDTPSSYVPTFEANCKPNYQSIMNYLFQLDGVGPNESIAFSNQTLLTLNETTAGSVTSLTDVSNAAASFPTSAWYVPYNTGSPVSPATRHCDGTPLTGDSIYRVDAPIAPIAPPWSNGQDLSGIGVVQTQERGFNDINNMDLRQVGATGGQFASLASLLSFGQSIAPLNIGAGGTVALGSGGTVALGSGGTATLGSGGNVTLGSGGTIALGSGGTVTLGSGGNVTLGSGGGTVTAGSSGTVTLGSGGTFTLGSGAGTVTLGSGGTMTLGSGAGTATLGSGGTYLPNGGGALLTITAGGGTFALGSGGTLTLGSGGTVTLGSGGTATLGSGGTVALGSGGTMSLGSGGTFTLGSGGTVTLGNGGTMALGSGGNVTLGSGGTVTLGSGGTLTLGSGGTVALGSGGTVTLGSGGNLALGSGGNVTLGNGGTATLGSGGTVTLGSGGTAVLGSGGTVTLGSGGTIAVGSGGTATLGSGGTVALGSGGTLTLGSGGTVTLGSGGTIAFASGGGVVSSSGGTYLIPNGGGTVTLGSGGTLVLGSGGTFSLGSGGTLVLGSGGTAVLGSGGTVTLGSGGTMTLGSGGTVTLGSGGVVTLGTGGSVNLGTGSEVPLGTVSSNTSGSGGPLANELDYPTANSVVRVPTAPTQTPTTAGYVRINWKAPAFGVVQTYTIYRSSNGATPIVIGSVSGVNGNPPATEFTDTNPDTTSKTVVYTITTTLVPDTAGASPRQSLPSAPAILKNDQTIVLGPLPSSVLISNPPTVTATAMSGSVPNGLLVVFSATGSCTIGSQSILNNVTSATVALTATGSCTVTASQAGNAAFNAANSVSGTFMVLPQGSTTKSQTISFAPLPNAQYGGPLFTLSASSSSGTPINFTASGPCTTAGTINGIGTCSITASAPASNGYSAASLTQSFTIYPAVLKVTANNLTSTYGQPLPALTYTYSGFVKSDTSAVVNGAPALSTTATAASNAGSYPITVSTGSLATTNYSFLYVTGSLTIQPANQSALTLIAASPLTYNQSETLSVSGGTANGIVTYTLVPGPCSIVGARLTANSGAGSCQVTATMAGNTNYNSVTSTPATVSLAPASQTITFTTAPPASAAYNSSFSVAATAASGGAVTFSNSGTGACSNTGALYKMTSGTGTCSVIANQSGNSNYAAAAPVTKTVNATLAAPAVTFTGAPANAAYQTKFTVATTTSATTTPVISSSGACTNVGTAVTMTSGTGTCALTAAWQADSNYAGTSASQSTTATKISPTVTFTGAPASAAYLSKFTVVTTTNATTTPVISSSGACTNVGTAVTMTSGSGTCALTATWQADANYAGSSAIQSTVATKIAPNVTFTGAPASAAYLSKFIVVTTTNATTTPVISSSGACINVGAAVTMTSGTGTCATTATWAADSNYSGTAASQSTAAVTLPQTITFTTLPPATAAYTSSFTVAATGGASANPVTFTSAGVCTNSGATFTMTNSVGTCSVIASQAGNSNYSGAPSLTKTVTATGPSLSVSPSSINFGTVYAGSISAQLITVTNSGNAPVTINDPILSIVKGGNSNEFVAINLCPRPLSAGKSCTMLIGFIAGPYYTPQTATLQIMSNAPGSPLPVTFSALVINPKASFNPTSLSFGTVKHATASSMNVVLSNPGGTTLNLNGISVTGTNASYFTQTNGCGTSLAAGASCTIAVKFTPAAVGTFSANLTVVDNAQSGGGTQTVALTGKGN